MLKVLSLLVIWIWLCAYLNCAGWGLSALHQLNAGGYAVVLALGLAGGLVLRKQFGVPPNCRWPKLRRRFRRGFPAAFLVLAVMAFLGGALNPANNYDALAYRTPRVLHWLAEGQWHWIHTEFQRLNTRTAGFEWLTTPQFLFLRTDRFVFLVNVISFLLLPGRFFAVLTRLGVHPRAAWHWMWLFPSGYGYVLQAGSVSNDMFGALMTFTAIEFALRASREQKLFYFWTAMLAAGLMTAAKAFNILLLLPWALVALPAVRLLLRRPAASFAVLLLAASASMVPTAVLNWRQCGDWTGLAAEQPMIGGGGKPLRFLANLINLPLNNLVPPIFPLAGTWDQLVARTLSPQLSSDLRANMELDLARFHLPELQVEEFAGLGAGLTVLLLVLGAKKIRAGKIWPRKWLDLPVLLPLAAWTSLGVFMMQVGATGPARYLLPFYPLLLAPLLTGAVAASFFQKKLWHGTALVCFGLAALLVVLTPARPLWPATKVLRMLDAEHSSHRLLNRAWNVYSAYDLRADGFADVIAVLPPDANPLGFVAFDEPEAGLWRPFGSRRIANFCCNDTAADVRARGIKYGLVSEQFLRQNTRKEPAEWLARMNAETVQHFDLKLRAGQEPHHWLLVKFR